MKTFTKSQIKKLKPYYKKVKILEDIFLEAVGDLEKQMNEDLNIKNTKLEFFFCDGSIAGIGDYSRSYKLIQSDKL